MSYSCASESKYVSDVVNCTDSFILYAYHQMGYKKKPHDHLFQMSGQPGTSSFAQLMYKNPLKVSYSYAASESKYV